MTSSETQKVVVSQWLRDLTAKTYLARRLDKLGRFFNDQIFRLLSELFDGLLNDGLENHNGIPTFNKFPPFKTRSATTLQQSRFRKVHSKTADLLKNDANSS